MKVPFFDLRRQYKSIQGEIEPKLLKLLQLGEYVSGSEVEGFEKEFASFVGAPYAVAVSSGTSALKLALLCEGIGKGDEVITPSMTFIATTAAVLDVGATPVLVDVTPCSLTLDPVKIKRAISKNTKAILPVHLHGHPADMTEINSIARAEGIKVIEDAAQAHGARHNGLAVGATGNTSCFSFYPAKNLGAFGEAGAITFYKEELADKAREIRNWGQPRKYVHNSPAYNERMDNIQAAILRIKLRHLASWNSARRKIANEYIKKIRSEYISLPSVPEGVDHVFHIFRVRTEYADQLRSHLDDSGIGYGSHYPLPVHQQPYIKKKSVLIPDALNETEAAAREMVSLPMFPEMSQEEIGVVIEALNDFSPNN